MMPDGTYDVANAADGQIGEFDLVIDFGACKPRSGSEREAPASKMTRRVIAPSFAGLGALTLAAILSAGCGRRGELLGTVDRPADAAVLSDVAGDANVADVVDVSGDAGDAGDAQGARRFSPPQLVTALSAPPSNSGDPTFTVDL